MRWESFTSATTSCRSSTQTSCGRDAARSRRGRSTAAREELPQQPSGARLLQSAVKLRRVVAGGLAEDAGPMLHPAALGIERAIVEAPDAGERDGGGTHRA